MNFLCPLNVHGSYFKKKFKKIVSHDMHVMLGTGSIFAAWQPYFCTNSHNKWSSTGVETTSSKVVFTTVFFRLRTNACKCVFFFMNVFSACVLFSDLCYCHLQLPPVWEMLAISFLASFFKYKHNWKNGKICYANLLN